MKIAEEKKVDKKSLKKAYDKARYNANKEFYKEYRKSHKKEIKKYSDSHKEQLKEYNKKYHKANKNEINQRKRAHHLTHKKNKSEYDKIYRKNNLSKINRRSRKWFNAKYKTNELFKLKCNIRNLIISSINNKYGKKTKRTEQILGCSFSEFKLHLESKFEHWMSWENHGKYNGEFNFGWDIDHIVPISTAKTLDDVLILSHYTNFQPLDSKINRFIKKNNV